MIRLYQQPYLSLLTKSRSPTTLACVRCQHTMKDPIPNFPIGLMKGRKLKLDGEKAVFTILIQWSRKHGIPPPFCNQAPEEDPSTFSLLTSNFILDGPGRMRNLRCSGAHERRDGALLSIPWQRKAARQTWRKAVSRSPSPQLEKGIRDHDPSRLDDFSSFSSAAPPPTSILQSQPGSRLSVFRSLPLSHSLFFLHLHAILA